MKQELPLAVVDFVLSYVVINVGRNNYFWLYKRSGNKSLLGFRIAWHLAEEAQRLLDNAKISFTRKPKVILLTADAASINANAKVFVRLAALVRRSWEKERYVEVVEP